MQDKILEEAWDWGCELPGWEN